GVMDGGETGIDCGFVCEVACPCDITIASSVGLTVPCPGGLVNLDATGQGSTITVLGEDFNGTVNAGWNSTGGATFGQPCGASPDGTDYYWASTSTSGVPNLTTVDFDMSCGGEICFDLVFASQGGTSPCEGPDEPDEGVSLQYSTDGGATWILLGYFNPYTGLVEPVVSTASSPFLSVGAVTNFTSWNTYCFVVPPGAFSPSTIFQWTQSYTSGSCCDNWGVDNVNINANACSGYYYDWDHLAGSPDDSNQVVNVTTTTTFGVWYTNGIDDSCYQDITIVVGTLDPVTATGTDEICIGDSDGTISISTATGGTGPYNYEISGPVTQNNATGSFSGLPPGSYNITVTDQAGCQTTTTFNILPGISCCPMTNTEAFTNVTCFGAGDGTITLTENLGAPTVNYSINGGSTSQTNGNFTGLVLGTYSVLITDGSGCTYSSVINITEPAAIIIADVVVDATCGLNNGQITLTGSGGSGSGYQYSIDNGGSFQGSGSFGSLVAGNYDVVVMDGDGCTAIMVVTVNNGGAPNIDAVAFTDPTCNGSCDGTITITASGGTGALQYSVDNGATFQATGTFTGLCTGNYDVVVQDAMGCPAIASATLTEPAAITFTGNIIDLLCEAVCSGVIDVVAVTGGNGVYQYSNDAGGIFQPGNSFNALCAGNYDLVVQDGNGCQGLATVTVVEPPPLVMALTQSDPICSGSCDGIIDLPSVGGSGIIIYSIDASATTQTTPTFTGLCAGTYNCVVEDANGCKLFATVILIDPVPVTFTSVVTDAVCGAANGQIDITAAGGDGVYQYSFDNGATYGASNIHTGAAAGSYDVIVQDGNGCADTTVISLSNAGAPLIDSIQFTEPTCAGACDGSITIFATGGFGAIQYSIDAGATLQASNTFTGVCAGTINVTIEDANGCQALSSTILTDPSLISYSVTTIDLACFNQCIGEINITGVSGGAGGYQFSNDNGVSFQPDSSFITLCAANYDVIVQDANGCTTSSLEVITEPIALTYTGVTTPNLCNVLNGACSGSLTLNEAGGTGVMQYSIDNGGTYQSSNVFANLCAGNYQVVIMDANGCTVTGTETITEPTALAYTTVILTTSCGTNNGSITVTASGGSSGVFEYSIDNGVTYGPSNFFGLLPAGAYNICIRDGNGCVFCDVVNVNNDPAQLITSLASTPETCFGSCDGTIDVQLTGGTPTFQYGLDGGPLQASNIFTGVCAGVHNIETVDASGCQVFGTSTVGGPAAMVFTTNLTDVDCFAACNGIIDFTSTAGGDGTYSYSIDNGVTFLLTATFNSLCAGTYDLVVQDGNNCSAIDQVILLEPAVLTMTFSATDAICNGYCDGTANVIIGGGVLPYNYGWTTGAGITATNSSGLCAGSFDLIVTDDHSCIIDTIAFVINEPVPFVITSVIVLDELCTGDCQGSINVTAPGASSFALNGGTNTQTTGLFTALCAGTYTINILDPSGCVTDTTVTIGQPTPITITPGNDTTICMGGTANIGAIAAGGTSGYVYDWGGAGVTSGVAVNPTTTTTYSVFATDANGCNSSSVDITVNVLDPMAPQAWTDASICPGETVQIQAEGNGGDGNYSFLWTNGQDATTMSNFQEMVSPLVTTQYIVIISDGCETPDVTDTVTITVLPTPDLLFSVDNYDGCTPLTVNFSNDTDPTMVSACEWDFGDGTSTTNCNPSHTYTIPGCYDVWFKVDSPDGCVSDTLLTSYICVYDVPIPDFTFAPQPASIVNPEINFTNTSINASSYYWDFGYNGETSTLEHPTVYFSDSVPGTYNVCLTAINGSGCDSTVCYDVIIDDEFLFYVPNTFTPDGDGINDVFRAYVNAYDVTGFQMLIFNRWGEVLFESSFPSVGWDGRAKGSQNIAETDVYVWMIKVKDSITNKEKIYKGHVTLLK
ncbi:MAG: gliding motility-associated C-terminal domain-containing protein, partial [Flavobacteriales bacterium]|nr:gliding motility-associated C-terminal domain-containing protein [Flavobacteriales bacterium]